MERSMICGGVPLFPFFAVLATFTNALTTENNNQELPIKVTTPRGLYEHDGFLAGEETPVWFADADFDEEGRPQYRYTRLNTVGTPMVKESVDYWKTIKNSGGFPIRRLRSINDRENLTYADEFLDAPRNIRINRSDSPSPVEKRSVNSNEVVYPSVLVVMDYGVSSHFVNNLFERRWSAEQLVVYALAFWGTVASSLRNIQNPRVSPRISGIVIAESRAATPYLSDAYYNDQRFNLSLSPMIDHWTSVSKRNNSQFPIGSYDIVVHMTDKCPWSFKEECTGLFRLFDPSLAVASVGPPCKLRDQIGGVIIYDDLAFNGLQRAIMQTSKVLGGSDETLVYYESSRKKWTQKMLDTISNALKNASCMSAPKQIHRPGTPVPQILAGEYMPSEKQCEAAGYAPDAWTCWDTSYDSGLSDCNSLKCSNQHVSGLTCVDVGPTLDGSFCNAEKTSICLDGECLAVK